MLLKASRIAFIILAEIKNNVLKVCGGFTFLNPPSGALSWLQWTASPSTIFSYERKENHFKRPKRNHLAMAKSICPKHPLMNDYRLCLAPLLVSHGTRCCGCPSNLYAVVVVTTWLQNFPLLRSCCVYIRLGQDAVPSAQVLPHAKAIFEWVAPHVFPPSIW